MTRPKYASQIAEYDVHFLEPLYQAVLAGDRRVFEARFERAVAQANVYHVDTGHPYIRWSVPAEPPDRGLDLSAGG